MPHPETKSPHLDRSIEPNFNWDDIRIFLKLAKVGSLRAAAIETGHSPKAMRGRIKALEAQVGAVLFNRTAMGVSLTSIGEQLVGVAEGIQKQARVFGDVSRAERRALKPSVRVGITEGLGVFWLTPMFGKLRESNPDIQMDLKCSMTPPNIGDLEVDLAIQLERPTQPNLMIRRIGHLHVVLYAAQSYIAAHGAPDSKHDIANFHFIEIEAPQIRSEKVEEEMTAEDKRRFVNMRVNTSSAQLVAAISGWGVTALPTYAPLVCDGLVHVAHDFILRREIFLAYHPHAAELPHVRHTIDWIIRSFDAGAYPWFREDYVSPAEIEALMGRDNRRSFMNSGIGLKRAS